MVHVHSNSGILLLRNIIEKGVSKEDIDQVPIVIGCISKREEIPAGKKIP